MYNNYFENVKELFRSSSLMVISSEVNGITETPASLFRKLCTKGKSYLLESAETVDRWGRYSYIGRKPFIEIKGCGNKVCIYRKGQFIEKTGKPLDIVKALIKEHEMPFIDNMPDFIGGAVGYIGYDIIRSYEDLSNVNHDDIELPDIHLLFMEEIFIYDHLEERVLIVFNLPTSSSTKDIDEMVSTRLQNIIDEISGDDCILEDSQGIQTKEFNYRSNETKEGFMEKVLQAKEYIKSGDIFQVVLSQRLQIETNSSPLNVYQTLRDINPSPYMFYLDFEEYSLVGSSPEMLCKVNAYRAETCPIAGTMHRGDTLEEDMKLAEELLNDEKELAEHLMLVDLARNDIGKVSKFGSVELTNYMEIQRYSHVMHIVSNVAGNLRDDLDMFDSLVSCLPAGTVSGAPKIRAMEIIDELENSKRGAYAGAVGCIGFDGNMDTCITIRTIVFKDSMAYIQAGAGIVADSDPESEYLETLKKATALMEAIKITEEDLHDSNNR